MERQESYCDGRLIKRVAMVDLISAANGMRHEWVDGRYSWFLDGQEVSEDEAQAYMDGYLS